MKCSDFSIQPPSRSLQLCLIYRLPDTSILKFCRGFSDYMDLNIASNTELILTGNFNMHVNNPLGTDATLFENTLETFGLHIHINFAMHQLQYSLVLIITQEDSNLTFKTSQCLLFFDHNDIQFTLHTER